MTNPATDPADVVINATVSEPERKHYYLRPSEYELYEFPTIMVIGTKEYQARVLIRQKGTENFVAFHSMHDSYGDAERVITAACDTFKGVGSLRIWDIFAETIGTEQGATVMVTQTKVLHWQLQQFS